MTRMTRTVGLLAVLGALQVSGQAFQLHNVYNTLYQQPYYNKQYGFHKPQQNVGFGYGGYGYGGYGYGGYGYGHGNDNNRKRERPKMLTCVGDDYSDGALSANIVEKDSFDNVFSNAFNYGYDSKSRRPGLKATFELLSDYDVDASLILTERGFIDGNDCDRDNFGRGLAPLKLIDSDKRGGYSYGGGYGDGNGGGGGYNNGFGFASADLFHGGKNGGYDVRRSKRKAPEGVLIEAELEDDTVQVFTFHELEGYTNIEHLAGRSLILCTDVDEDYDHRAVCLRGVLACCILGFDHEERFIDNNGHDKGHHNGHGKGHYKCHDNGHGKGHDNGHGKGHGKGHDNGHDNGHGKGHDNGHDNGHGKGHDNGHDNGHGKGHDKCHDNGHDYGHDNGHDKGHDKGHDNGHDKGHDKCHDYGHDKGHDKCHDNGHENGQKIIT